MKPKEKAKEEAEYLINKFIRNARHFEEGNMFAENSENAKQCALICVGEILDQFPKKGKQYDGTSYLMFKGKIEYWQEVKQEIKELQL